MTTKWNGDATFSKIRKEAAEILLVCAVRFEQVHSQRVSVANPPPYLPATTSKPGEYPRLRTGAGQKALTHQPASVAEVMQTGYVRVGFVESDHHLLILELWKKGARLGMLRTLEDIKPQLQALIGSMGSAGANY